MHKALSAKQTETNQTQATPEQQPTNPKQTIQRAIDPNRLPFYAQAWGNRPPPGLRLADSELASHNEEPLQKQTEPLQRKENNTGLPVVQRMVKRGGKVKEKKMSLADLHKSVRGSATGWQSQSSIEKVKEPPKETPKANPTDRETIQYGTRHTLHQPQTRIYFWKDRKENNMEYSYDHQKVHTNVTSTSKKTSVPHNSSMAGPLTRHPLWESFHGNAVPPALRLSAEPLQRKENNTGLPDTLKTGVEGLSGLSMDDVQVHYNSSKPAEVQALAYTQGAEIHVGPGQEQHLAHEAWHVVQQKQGRVQATMQMKGVAINDEGGLEQEADAMVEQITAGLPTEKLPDDGVRLRLSSRAESIVHDVTRTPGTKSVLQRKIEYGTSKYLPNVSNMNDLVEKLVEMYGENHRKIITEDVQRIEANSQTWTLYNIYRRFNKKKLPRFTEVAFGTSSSKPTLPLSEYKGREPDKAKKRYAAINQFSFNSVTRLVAFVGNKQFNFRNATNEDLHAEEQFMSAAESAGGLKNNPIITITINNSPCVNKCAKQLADWVKRHKLTDVTIHFANPYGSDEDFSKAIKYLQAAGIKIHGFEALENVGSDTDQEIEDKYRDRFNNMAVRLRRVKTNNLYQSDTESGQEEEGGSDMDQESDTY